jgi:hypothetical protein
MFAKILDFEYGKKFRDTILISIIGFSVFLLFCLLVFAIENFRNLKTLEI